MTTWNDYQDAAQAYANGVRTLFFPVAGVPVPGQARAPAPEGSLADRAARLAPLSDSLTQAASGLLNHDDPDVRVDGATRLLAKALADLQVSAHLLAAARAEEEPAETAREFAGPSLVMPDVPAIEENLGLLLAGPRTMQNLPAQARGNALAAPPNLPPGRMELARTIVDTLVNIRDQAARTGQNALGGLLGLGATQLAQAAALVGMDIAQAVGQAETVSRLYGLFRDFAVKAYDALIATLGPELARMAANQATSWIAQLQSGQQFGQLLDQLYQTPITGSELGQLVATSQAAPDKFVTAEQAISVLRDQYARQTDLAAKLIRGLGMFGIAPAVALPQGRLLLAAAFLVLGSYVVLAGGDFVDAPRLRLINRVPGVRTITEENLGPVPAPATP